MQNIRLNLVSLFREKRLAKNVAWNLLGTILPLVVGLFTIPILINSLGTDKFGVLTLAWMVIGYFSLFDLGLGRSLTKFVAEKLGAKQLDDIPSLIWTALMLMSVMGIIGGVIVASISSFLVTSVLNIPEILQMETLKAFYLLALSIPIVIGTTGLRGVLEGYQCFGLVNAVRIPMGLFTFIGPLLVLSFSNSLYHIVAVLLAGRILTLIIYILLCLHVVPAMKHALIRYNLVKPLLYFGGWLTVSNIIGPLMLYIDRFLIGAFISIGAVAYYTTPYEVIIKLLFIPSTILGVMFPAFSHAFANKQQSARLLYTNTIKYVFIIMFPFTIVCVLFGDVMLEIWLNEEFSKNSFHVAQLLSIGVLINAYGLISQAMVQASGRSDLTAKLHLIELPLYLLYLPFLMNEYGINGAAMAWVIRVTISAVALAFLAQMAIENTKINKNNTDYKI